MIRRQDRNNNGSNKEVSSRDIVSDKDSTVSDTKGDIVSAGRGADLKGYDSEDISGTGKGASQRPARKKTTNPPTPPPKTKIKRRQTEEEDVTDVEDMRTGMDRAGRVSANAVIEALKKTDGMVTLAAELLRVSYDTLSKYIKNNKKVQASLYAIEQNILDRVQSRLMRMIEQGNAGSVYFFLKCKGKERGFVESVHHVTTPTKPITFKYQLVLPEGYKQEVKQIENKVIDITPDGTMVPAQEG